MKTKRRTFFESEGAPEKAFDEKVFSRVNPILDQFSVRSARLKNSEIEKSGLGAWFSFSWKWLALGASAAALAIIIIPLLRTEPARIADVAPVVQAPVAQSPVAVVQITPVPTAIPLVAKATKPVRPTVSAKMKDKRLAAREVVQKQQARIQKVAVEFLTELDVLLVLPVLRDLDVLMKWSGHSKTACLLPDPRWFDLISIAEAMETGTDDFQLSDDFLDQILLVFRKIPPKQQATMLASLDRLKGIWRTKKDVLIVNYNVWRSSSPAEQQVYHERYATWKALPPKTRTEVLNKFERWKKLSANEQAQIRKRILKDEQAKGSRG